MKCFLFLSQMIIFIKSEPNLDPIWTQNEPKVSPNWTQFGPSMNPNFHAIMLLWF